MLFQPIFGLYSWIKKNVEEKNEKTNEENEKNEKKNGRKSFNILYFLVKWEWAFIFDFIVYVMASFMAQNGYMNLPLEDGTIFETYLKPCNVWRISSMAITLAWINLLVYLRQVPVLGKYIIVLNDIIFTFASFSIILLIFLLSFTLGYLVLLKEEGGSFENFSDAFLKTMVMMSGEFDAGDIFFPDDASSNPFPDITYAFFLIFFVLASLLLINMLVGLTVEDVSTFVEVAKLKKMSNRLKFVLNMEKYFVRKIRFLNFTFPLNPIWFLKSNRVDVMTMNKTNVTNDLKSKMWKQVVERKKEEEIIQEENLSEDIKKVRREMSSSIYQLRDEAREREKEAKEREDKMVKRFQTAMNDLKTEFHGMDQRLTAMDRLQSADLKLIDERAEERDKKTNDERVKAINDIRSTLNASINNEIFEREVEQQRVINFMIDIGNYNYLKVINTFELIIN